MKQCPKCGKEVDKDMVICPGCGEPLYNPNNKSYELLSIHLVRFLLIIALLLPFVGTIISMIIRKRYPMFSKVLLKNSGYGYVLWVMMILLLLICYLALFSMGVGYL